MYVRVWLRHLHVVHEPDIAVMENDKNNGANIAWQWSTWRNERSVHFNVASSCVICLCTRVEMLYLATKNNSAL